jgi:hypothetical protein
LVLKAQIGAYDVDRIFMDAGSEINLIYEKTLRAMHISLEFLKPTDCSFYGIVPGSANYPLGRIALNVCFGNRQNYRREKLDFKVMDWPSQYHAILGRPAFSRFMAVPHYTYLMSTHASVLVDSVGPPSAEVCRQQQVSLKWITQGLSNSGRKRSKLSLSNNPAIMIQKVSCVPNTPNTLVRCIGALLRRRDSEIQVV